MKSLLILGTQGQLARALKLLVPSAICLGRGELDMSHPDKVAETLEKYQPTAIINAAAYTQVDNAESEEELATTINAVSPAAVAIYCAARHIPFVHFSTDYVFDGSGDIAWKEIDTPSPLNAYGRSKLAGEEAIARVGGKYLIFRTSWLYDAQGKNFLNTMLRLAADRESLKIIDDQWGAPTYAAHLAEGALAALEHAQQQPRFPSGVYHLCNQGETTWFRFANAIFSAAQRSGMPLKIRSVEPISATQYPLPASRPYNSRLDCTKALSILGVALPSWQEGLRDCMEVKREG